MKKFLKRFFSVLLAAILALQLAPAAAFAEESEERILNYQEVDFSVESPRNKTIVDNTAGSSEESEIALLPQYSSVEAGFVAPVKDQGSDGTCWAFAATAACENAYNKKEAALQSFSTIQLVNFFYDQKHDPLGNASGDATSIVGSTKLLRGGNHAFTMWGLVNWINGATEEALPYGQYRTLTNASQIPEEYANLYDIAHLQNAYILPYGTDEASMSSIKNAIARFGSVACAYYHSTNYYNSANGAYYCEIPGINHSVCIVGWNDNYPKENFGSLKPAADGAWLVKNSWGENWGTDGDSNAAHSGQEGYLWISYYDRSISYAEEMYAFDFRPTDEYQYNYQYDGSCGLESLVLSLGNKFGAIYQVEGLTAEQEKLDAVGAGFYSTDMSGTVYIYKNPTEGNPVSGELVAMQTFATTYAGYYTIDLAQAPVFDAGDTFSVVFECLQKGAFFVDSSYTNGNWIRFTADTLGDKTYLITPSSVVNLGNMGYTARVKAYTNDYTGEPEEPPVEPPVEPEKSVEVSVTQSSATVGKGTKAITTYTTRIEATAEGTEVEKVEYSLDNAESWTEGTSFTTGAPAENFLIRVTDTEGDVYWFLYDNGEISPAEPIAKGVTLEIKIQSSIIKNKNLRFTEYTVTLTPKVWGTDVVNVEYALIEGAGWIQGTQFTVGIIPDNFSVRITDSDNDVHVFTYENGTIYRL